MHLSMVRKYLEENFTEYNSYLWYRRHDRKERFN
jgi:hypothetical protein